MNNTSSNNMSICIQTNYRILVPIGNTILRHNHTNKLLVDRGLTFLWESGLYIYISEPLARAIS